jgi:hypothetical protein
MFFYFSFFRFFFLLTPNIYKKNICIVKKMYINSSGIEGNPTVFYRLMPGSTAQTNKFHTFYLQQRPDNGDTWADIKVNHPLDYETIKEYNLTIRVEVRYDFYFSIKG